MTARIKLYKQFFTPDKYSQIMISKLPVNEPKHIVDLAIGEGALLIEASKRWPNAKLYGNDIDPLCCDVIHSNIKKVECYNLDIFFESSIQKLIQNIGKVDLCIGNPPFDLIEQNKDIKKILSLFSLDAVYKSKYIPAEIIYILQCLRILKTDGLLSLILPDGFFVNNALQYFRKFLLTNFTALEIIELPIDIFENTKAKTHILTLKNKLPIDPEKKSIKLTDSSTSQSLMIHFSEAIERMDYNSYHSRLLHNSCKKLSDFDVEIIRGKAKHLLNDLDRSHVLHTTNFKESTKFISKLKDSDALSAHKDRIAKKGDIVIPRVGTNILGRVGYVEDGYFVATDCIFLLRVKSKTHRKLIFRTLQSKYGKQWILSISKGVGARHITLKDIINLPIIDRELAI